LPQAACRIYAPVGGHRDLLAYLVRRLLENGANSSFVSSASDPAVPIAALLQRPQIAIGDPRHARHPKIPLPGDLYAPERRNSAGIELGERGGLEALIAEVRQATGGTEAAPLVDGIALAGRVREVKSPIDGAAIGRVTEGDAATASAAMTAAEVGFAAWAVAPIDGRARALEGARASEARRAGSSP
jgi:RHH-type proline utilization regulon transcriptional repressor/proline dehydrogenase/delta 1-pyrroline-5-carboxylate dehydrogenase